MSYQNLLNAHSEAIDCLPTDTRVLVLDALRVRAMDFVADRLWSDGGDLAADVYRTVAQPSEDEQPFNPDTYED